MIFTKVFIDNLRGFKDTLLDLSYPRKIQNSPIEHEYLEGHENFRVKRLCIISGANASGKTSFGKILCEIVNIIEKGMDYIQHNSISMLDQSQVATIEVEFILQDSIFRTLKIMISDGFYWFEYIDVKIAKSDSVEVCRKKIADAKLLDEDEKNNRSTCIIRNIDDKSKYFDKWECLKKRLSQTENSSVWAFSFSDSFDNSDNKLILSNENQKYKSTLLSILQTFDPSIERISSSIDDESGKVTEYTIHFSHGKFCRMDVNGKVDSDYQSLLSMGTYQGVSVAGFIHFILTQLSFPDHKVSGTFFLDEKMAYSHTEIERAIVNLIAQKINNHSQFFYTTHNYDILTMGFALHSFVFLTKSSGDPKFVWANEACNKNDRGVLPFVEANFFSTLPDTYLLDEILWDNE